MFGAVEEVLWVTKPGCTKLFGTQICVAYGCCDWFWVPKDKLSWLFSTQISVGALMTVDNWVLKRLVKAAFGTHVMILFIKTFRKINGELWEAVK